MGLLSIKLSAVPAVILVITAGVGVEFTVHICLVSRISLRHLDLCTPWFCEPNCSLYKNRFQVRLKFELLTFEVFKFNRAVADSRFYTSCDVYLLIFIVEQNFLSTVVFGSYGRSHHLRLHDAPYIMLRGNVASSTKPEVHSVLQCCQQRTKAQPACTKNLVKFGRVVFEISEQTDRQTYSSQYFAVCTLHGGEVKMCSNLLETNSSLLSEHLRLLSRLRTRLL